MSIRHIQKTFVYCCQCKKEILVSEVTVNDGNNFLKYDPLKNKWNAFYFNETIHYVCPKHDLNINIFIDGKLYKD